jgi:hypothetical protein
LSDEVGVKRGCLFSVVLLLAAVCYSQSVKKKELQFDLSKIGSVVDGHQVCEDKYRVQDYPSEVIDQIIAAGPKSVPVLIGMLTDTRTVKTEEPIICFWGVMTISDIAFCVLEDLFLDPDSAKATIAGAGWNEMLGANERLPAWEQLHRFTQTHGNKALQARWQTLWDKYSSQLSWDPKARCFKLKAQ